MRQKTFDMRRYNHRKPVRVVCECSRVSGVEEARAHFVAYTRDISVWGAHMVLQHDVCAHDRLIIRFEIPKFFLPVVVCGEVLWRKDALLPCEPRKEVCEAGVRFLYIDSRSKKKLEEYIDETHSATIM